MAVWLISVLVLVFILVYKFILKPQRYWSEQGVLHNTPWPILGDMAKLLTLQESLEGSIKRLYNSFPNARYNGLYQFMTPILMVKDLDLIKKITVKDFDYFHDHKQVVTEEQDILFGKSLVSLKGERWRDMRATLSPAFTSSKMKAMFILITKASEQFSTYFMKECDKDEVTTVSMKDVFTRYTNDVVATTAFGLNCNSLEEKNNEFFNMGKDLSKFTILRMIKFVCFSLSPKLFKLLRLSLFPRYLHTFFRRIINATITLRKEKGIVRPDMIHLLMEAQKGRLKHDNLLKETEDAGFATVQEVTVGTAKRELSDDDIIAQAMLFFFAGFSTSSTLMCFMASELALNPEIQKKLQKEIDQTLDEHEGNVTYETLLQMKYLDMTVSEALRKWPPGVNIERMCCKEYTIPPSSSKEKPYTIEKGIMVIIPILGLHNDPKYFPNPDIFDPERFSDENKANIQPATYIPFGVGPRNCIGSRFALLQTKSMFIHLLSKFDIVVVENTKIPPTLAFNLDDFWLGLKPRVKL